MMKKYGIFLAGDFVETNNHISIRNSFSEKIIAEVCLAGDTELETAIIAGKNAEKSMAILPSYKKYEILMQIASELGRNKSYFSDILSAEACKPLKLAESEVERAVQTFIVAAEESKRLPKEYLSLDWTQAASGKEGLVKYFPIGLIAGISPFNFPLNLAVHKIAPAIASGCPMVIKPSSLTPLSTLELAAIIQNTDLPKGALSVLPMTRKTGNHLVSDERFRLLTFTGSPEVGWKMKSEAGKKKVVLELGGNAGVIISKTADIEMAVQKCVFGGFSYAGQVCIHTQRIFIQHEIFNDFTNKFIEAVKQLKSGPADERSTDISALIDEDNAIRVEEWIQDAVSNGAKLLLGGGRSKSFIEPTIITNTKPDMNVSCCEVFGPVVVVEPFLDFKQAVEEINNSRFGLQAGVFTDSVTEMDYAFNNIEAGGVMINEVPTFRVDHMPYGGIKDSGLGREGVKYAIHDMLEPRIMVR